MSQCENLFNRLKSGDTEVLREAAFEAGESQCIEAVPLLAELLTSSNLGVQEAAEQSLRKLGGSETVRAVIPLLRSESAPIRNLAMDILRQVGAQDIPALIELLHDDDSDIRIFASDILGSSRSPLAVEPLCAALLKDPEPNVRYQAAISLGDLGITEAAKCLNQALRDEEWVQFAVVEALSKVRDEGSVGAMLKALDTSSDLVASMIIEALGEMGDIKAVSRLLKRLDTSHSALRNKIIKAIMNILGGKALKLLSGQEREKFRDYLLAALKDEDEEIQDAAMRGLSYVGGDKASAAILDLVGKLDPDKDHDRRERAVETLANIGLTRALSETVKAPTTRGEVWLKTRAAVRVLGMIQAPEASRLLMDVFWEKDSDMQKELCRDIMDSLVNVAGEEAKGFMLDILDRHEDGYVLKRALYFLGRKFKVPESLDRICALLEHPFDDVKEAALEACVGIDGPEMSERFRELFHSPDPVKRVMAVYGFSHLGISEYRQEIEQALSDEVPEIRKLALEAFADKHEYNKQDSLNLIVSRLNDDSREVRLSVVQLLAQYPPELTVPHLLSALDDEDDWVKIRALESLAEIKHPDSVNNLVPLLESENKLVLLKVVEVLGMIGGSVAFKSLLDLLGSDDQEIVEKAEEAISKLRQQQELES